MGRRERRRAAAAFPTNVSPAGSGARFAVGLIWGVVMVVIFVVVIFSSMLLGAVLYLRLHHFRGYDQSWLVPFAGMAGAVLATAICHLARGWVQRLRVSRLRRTGIATTGRVVARLDEHVASTRGPGMTRYRVDVEWTDENGPQLAERRYRFYGLGNSDFEALTNDGAKVLVRYPPGRSRRVLIDIPFAPTMADQFI